MTSKDIILDPVKELTTTATTIKVRGIRLSPDDSGDWKIIISLDLTIPERNEIEGVVMRESHSIDATITVLRQEIADAASIDVDLVRSSLTLEQIETYITIIALSKIYQVFEW